MDGENWTYANYAMQAFCGLLNSEDRLFITYMSEAQRNRYLSPPEISLIEKDLQKSVDEIRNRYADGGTPISAVEIAFNKLKSISDSNENTQYWLVVISDGAFDDGTQTQVSETALNNMFAGYSSTQMPNGTKPRITYLGIGDNVIIPKGDANTGRYVYEADGAESIMYVMSNIADQISGRSKLADDDIKLVDKNKIQITSAVPLLNIAVLVQGVSAEIVGISDKDGNKLEVGRSIDITADQKGLKIAPTLKGGAFVLGNGGDNIYSGTYTIEFDRDVTLDNVVVMFEPALEIRMDVLLNGKKLGKITDLWSGTNAGDDIGLECGIYEIGTDKKIEPSVLPAGTAFSLRVTEDGKETLSKSGSDMKASGYKLKNAETIITAEMTIKGFNPIRISVDFTPEKAKTQYAISSQFEKGIKSIKTGDLANNEQMKILFTVTADGKQITDPSTIQALNPGFVSSPSGCDGNIEYRGDGTVVYTPKSAVGIKKDENVDVTVTMSIGNVSASETYTLLAFDYAAFVSADNGSVRKNEFFGNTVGASFWITKDGVRLGKSEMENSLDVSINKEHENLTLSVEVLDDGTVRCVPVEINERKIGVFGAIEELRFDSEEKLLSVADVTRVKEKLKYIGARFILSDKIIGELTKCGLIDYFNKDGNHISVSYKNNIVKMCLTNAGRALEMKSFLLAGSITDDDGNAFYNDVMTGVCIDWDGEIHNSDEGCDTENEVDVILMKGIVPVFISCKNGYIDIDELYKLNTVAERFGGEYAKKVLVINSLDGAGKFAEHFRQRAKDMKIRLVENIHKKDEHELVRVFKSLWCN